MAIIFVTRVSEQVISEKDDPNKYKMEYVNDIHWREKKMKLLLE